MNNDNALLTQPINKIYFKYFFTAVLSGISISLYIFFDTLFLGRATGDIGLSTITLTLPYIIPFNAVAMLIAYGAPAVMAIELGRNDKKAVNDVFSLSIATTLVFSAIIAALSLIFLTPICRVLGATDELLPHMKDYLGIIMVSTPIFAVANTLIGAVRIDGNPHLAMTSQLLGNGFNIVFDYILIYPLKMGVKGAAIATALSPILTLVILLFHFRKGRSELKFKFKFSQFSFTRRIIASGFVGFIGEFAAGAVIFMYNIMARRHGGYFAVAAYAAYSNAFYVLQNILISACMSAQPIFGVNFGAKQYKRVNETAALVLKYSLAIGAVFAATAFFFAPQLGAMFSQDGNAAYVPLVAQAFRFSALSMLIMPLFYMPVAALYATEHAFEAGAASFMRSVVVPIALLLILPALFGLNGVWMTQVFSDIIVAVFALYMLKRSGLFQRGRKAV